MSSPFHSQYVTAAAAAVATVGAIGGTYYAYKRYTQEPERVIVLPEKWTYAGKLTNLYIYPVKSCGGVVVDKMECSLMGPKNSWLRDRVLMLIDQKNNFLNARGYPELLKVKTSMQGSVLTLEHESQEPCRVNLAEVAAIGRKLTATFWGNKVDVQDCGFESGEWFSRLLARTSDSYRLVYYSSPNPRQGKPVLDVVLWKFTKDDLGALPDEVSYNMINESSIDDLNFRLKEKSADPVTHRNFRPNFVITGAKAFAEDDWNFIKIRDTVFEVIKPCVRCIMTTIDPDTGVRDRNNEPLKTLRSYRQATDEATRRAMGTSPRMGVQMALRSPPGGLIYEGDDIYFG